MRTISLILFFALSSAIQADIPKPETREDTLDMMFERLLPTDPDTHIDKANHVA